MDISGGVKYKAVAVSGGHFVWKCNSWEMEVWESGELCINTLSEFFVIQVVLKILITTISTEEFKTYQCYFNDIKPLNTSQGKQSKADQNKILTIPEKTVDNSSPSDFKTEFFISV